MTIDARPARKTDIPDLSRTLGGAFFDDPVMTWLVPDDAARAKQLPRLFAILTRHHHLNGDGVEVACDGSTISAAALWDPPNRWKTSRRAELAMMPSLVRALGSRLAVGWQTSEMMKRAHPEEPHWYLAVIGSDIAVRGHGFGQVLMRSRLDRVDAEHAPAYLESSKPENVPYYERFGFSITGEITLPGDGPTVWTMWRAAR